jgi:hypothetical protein
MKKLNKKQLNTLVSSSVSSSVSRMIVLNSFVSEMMNKEVEVVEQVVETKLVVPVETEFNFKPINWSADESNFKFAPLKTEVVKKEEKVSKSVMAKRVFDEMYNESIKNGTEMKRSDILKRFVAECDLTTNGAATYLQNIKKERGLVNSK